MPFEIKNTKDFPYFKDFFKHEAACIVQHSVYNKTGNAHKNELDEKYQTPLHPSFRNTPLLRITHDHTEGDELTWATSHTRGEAY